jgi:hypothetical protein
MIINILNNRKALYRVYQYYEKKDMELLFGEQIEPARLNTLH